MGRRAKWRSMGTVGLAAALIASVSLMGCSTDDETAERAARTEPETYAVGVVTETYVNSESPLVANAETKSANRSLETTVFYPAPGAFGAGPVADAPAATKDGPYPLIVFAHGLGASAQAYEGLLAQWASAGYIVAAPAFPNTNANAADGIDPGDFANQPADVSAVITAILRASKRAEAPLAGLVQRDGIGIAGHSLGGITALGVAANSCCRDQRVKAAVVMSGDPLRFPKGRFNYAKAPPILMVHGTDDKLVTYEASVDVFNRAEAPKGVLTIKKGDHGAPMNPTGPAFDEVVAVTTTFFDAYLKEDPAALNELAADGNTATTKLVFAAEPGTRVTLPTASTLAPRDLSASVAPETGLVNRQTVTVAWSGFTPGNTINIVQCSNRIPGDATACDLENGKLLQPNPTGTGSLELLIVTGPVGSGVCDSDHPDCQIVINDGGSLDPAASVRISIDFAAA